MSVTPVDIHPHSLGEEDENCEQCRRSQVESGSSSEEEEKSEESDSFYLTVDQKGLQGTALRLQKMEGEVAALRSENEVLAQKNRELLRLLRKGEGEKELKRQLKAKEAEIKQLKSQLIQNSY
jgi:DNA-binding CsgD family transcriptional regulator